MLTPPRSVDGNEVAPSPILGGQLGIQLASGVNGDAWRYAEQEVPEASWLEMPGHFPTSAPKNWWEKPSIGKFLTFRWSVAIPSVDTVPTNGSCWASSGQLVSGHYLAGNHFTIHTEHDSLCNLPNQPTVNRRVWKWVQVLQGYDCDIVHIAGKSNPADHLSQRSIKELKSMVDVRHTEESMVQKLRLGEGKSTDEDIQRKLDQVFAEGHPDRSSEQINSQANSFNSLNSFSSSIFSTRSTIRLDSTLRGEIREGLDNDTRWVTF